MNNRITPNAASGAVSQAGSAHGSGSRDDPPMQPGCRHTLPWGTPWRPHCTWSRTAHGTAFGHEWRRAGDVGAFGDGASCLSRLATANFDDLCIPGADFDFRREFTLCSDRGRRFHPCLRSNFVDDQRLRVQILNSTHHVIKLLFAALHLHSICLFANAAVGCTGPPCASYPRVRLFCQ